MFEWLWVNYVANDRKVNVEEQHLSKKYIT